jgi:GNAT superfamily N-acetyltransferase
MYNHRTYVEQSDDFNKMCELVSYLNSMHLCDWSLGRIYSWKYGRWSKESQCDSLFEKQAELFFDDSNVLCGIIITENFGENYYILSKKDKDLLQSMIDFLLESERFNKQYVITVPVDDICQVEILERNGFVLTGDADITYRYNSVDITLPYISIPDDFTITSQKEYLDETKAELLRFYAFNPDGIYDDVIDHAYKYARKNPILTPDLSLLLLNEHGEPISTCMGLLDEKNQTMEVEVVATKKDYENRGFAKVIISECIKRGISRGVKEISISAWNEKTRKIYSSFGKPHVLKKVNYKKVPLNK